LEYINRPIFTEDNIRFWNDNYIIDSLARKFDKIIS
jgi:hypothetical protein